MLLELLSEHTRVLNSAVVDQGDAILVIRVRVSILVSLASVCGPTCVRNTDLVTPVLLGGFCADDADGIRCGAFGSDLCSENLALWAHCGHTSRVIAAYPTTKNAE
jgi:hypothetical protein